MDTKKPEPMVPNPTRQLVFEAVRDLGGSATTQEIAKHLRLKKGTIKPELYNLLRKDKLLALIQEDHCSPRWAVKKTSLVSNSINE